VIGTFFFFFFCGARHCTNLDCAGRRDGGEGDTTAEQQVAAMRAASRAVLHMPCCICRAGSLGAGLQGRTARLWLRVVNVRYAETGCCCMCMLLCLWGAEGRCNG
jgi:hypothetical protein